MAAFWNPTPQDSPGRSLLTNTALNPPTTHTRCCPILNRMIIPQAPQERFRNRLYDVEIRQVIRSAKVTHGARPSPTSARDPIASTG
jgi:hypothetical protein